MLNQLVKLFDDEEGEPVLESPPMRGLMLVQDAIQNNKTLEQFGDIINFTPLKF